MANSVVADENWCVPGHARNLMVRESGSTRLTQKFFGNGNCLAGRFGITASLGVNAFFSGRHGKGTEMSKVEVIGLQAL